jgi:hypothetical protein
MKKIIVYFILFLLLVSGCIYQKGAVKSVPVHKSETVVSDGIAPIVNNDIVGAKQASLSDALKNALALVVGVYVSQESLVSKAVMLDDNIISKTDGYIEKYKVIKEERDGEFYKIKLKAVVRKEDLEKEIKSLALDPKNLGNPVVKFDLEEYMDGIKTDNGYATDLLKKKFLEKGFKVSDSDDFDILISGKVQSNFNTAEGLAGFTSYRSNINLSVKKANSQDLILTKSETGAGIDITKDLASKKSIENVAILLSKDFADNILKFLDKDGSLQIIIYNVNDLQSLQKILMSIRGLAEVKDCLTRNYKEGVAIIDVYIKTGDSLSLSKKLEKMDMFKIDKITSYDIYLEKK